MNQFSLSFVYLYMLIQKRQYIIRFVKQMGSGMVDKILA